LIEAIKEKVISRIQDYLVNQFLKKMKASRLVVIAVNAIMSFDAMYVLRGILAYYGMTKFLKALFWLSMIM
jgi:hypothetical protein